MIKIKSFYTFLSHLSKRERLILYIAAGFTLLLILDRLIVHPVLSKMRSLDKEIQAQTAQIKKDFHILTQKEKIIAESRRYASYSLGELSAEEATTSLLKELEDLANKASVYLVDIKPAGIKQEAGYSKYLVNLSCEAQMEQVIDFMYNIENSKKLLRIEKYNISPKSKESSIAKCSMTISLRGIL